MKKKESKRRVTRWITLVSVSLILIFGQYDTVYATETSEQLLEELLEEIDFTELDSFLGEAGSNVTFYELMLQIIEDGWGTESIEKLMRWCWKQLFYELQVNKALFLEVILIAFCFSLLKNTAGTFGNEYLSEACFLLIYSVLALLLLKSMYMFQSIVAKALTQCISFMEIFVPCFCTGMFLSANGFAASGFYQIAFVVIFLVESAFGKVLLPGIHIYVLLQIFNHFFEEGQFGNLAELIETFLNWSLKAAMTMVVGLSAVQNLIHPVKDRMAQGALSKTVAAIPGLGNAVSGMNEVLLGAGMMIKNGVGLAGIVALLLLGMGPLLKTGCLAFSYKMMSAVTEPLTDRRISNCLKDLSKGAVLYMKLLGDCLLLFFVMIAITVSATSFVY